MIAAVIMAAGAAQASVVIFSENMGTVSSNTAIETHDANEGFQNSSTLAFMGTGDVRTSTASSGYDGASGDGNVFLTGNDSKTFIISGINTTGYDPGTYKLSFGVAKSLIASDMTELHLHYSADAENWSPILIPAQPTGEGTTTWRLLEFSNLNLPQTETLSLRWTNTVIDSATPQFRLDDVTLTAMPEPAAAALFGGLGLLLLVARRRLARLHN